MARTAQIDYQRVTFSFPKKIIIMLRNKVEKENINMSKYVSDVVEDCISREEKDINIDEFIKSLKELRKTFVPNTKKSSLEILREIRYGEK